MEVFGCSYLDPRQRSAKYRETMKHQRPRTWRMCNRMFSLPGLCDFLCLHTAFDSLKEFVELVPSSHHNSNYTQPEPAPPPTHLTFLAAFALEALSKLFYNPAASCSFLFASFPISSFKDVGGSRHVRLYIVCVCVRARFQSGVRC